MLRRLILMRHAKSSWKSGAPTDFERPLNKRGRRDAPRVAVKLRELDWVPDLVVSSDSARTVETLELMREALGTSVDIELCGELYHGGLDELRAVAGRVGDDVGTLLALGHNPGWEEALEALTGEDEELETACAALLYRSASSWERAMSGQGEWRIWQVIRPREL